VFAGAAREAVFSNPDVIKRVNADFIPVALKAGLVNNPPGDEEGLLYREIERSKPAPQGICVVNSAGKVLNWTLMFDDDKSVLAFLDHAKERFAKYPDAKKPVAAEVYQKFPSQKREDVADSGKDLPVLDRHPEGKHCPAEPPLRKGTVAVRLFGRALDKDGKPVADTVRSENYIEDRFNIAVQTQEELAKALAEAGKDPVKLPLELTRQWVKQAYMGVLGVGPLDDISHLGKGALKKCDFGAQKVASRVALAPGVTLWRVEGESETFVGKIANAGVGDMAGDMHEVKLKWHGFIEMNENRMTRLVLSAGGEEKLKFNSERGKDENEVAILPGGHRVDMACGVRYGILGEPAGPDKVAADAPDAPQPGAPQDARRQITETLGPPFLVFRDKVQEELKLSDEQKKKLDKRFQDTVQDAMPFFQPLGDKKGEEREKELQSYREKAQEKLTAFLKETLKDEQLKRLQQLELQQEGPFALLFRPDLGKELKITEDQRKQFMAVVQEMQTMTEPLVKEVQSGGNPQEIGPKIMKVRKDHEGKLEALLTDVQKKQWLEMLGKALAQDAPAAPQPGAPEDAGRQLTETLGPPFLVFRDKVQEELKLSDEQKKKLEKRLQDTVQDAMPFFQNLGDKKGEEREKELHAYVQKAQENLTAFLEGALKEEQFKRLRQVMLQREGLFGLGHPEIMKELEITDKQRQQFMEVMQDMQQKMEPVMKEAQKGGKPEEIAPKLMKLRQEHEGKIEAILDDAQKKQWKELLGKPLDLGD
jgi:transcription termination factor NusB